MNFNGKQYTLTHFRTLLARTTSSPATVTTIPILVERRNAKRIYYYIVENAFISGLQCNSHSFSTFQLENHRKPINSWFIGKSDRQNDIVFLFRENQEAKEAKTKTKM